MAFMIHKDDLDKHMDTGKYVRYTTEQIEALERVYVECPKPSSLKRQQLVRECPILSNIEPKQIKVWFQNRRCREKQKKEAYRLQAVNRKLSAMNKLLMEENDRLQKQVSHLVYENGYMRQQLHTLPATTADNSCESAVMSGQPQQQNSTHQHLQKDANSPAGLLAIAEEAMAEFLSKATGTAVDWVQMVGMKPGPDSIGFVAVSRNSSGVAARACGLVSLEPMKVAEILKDRISWCQDYRSVDVCSILPTGNGGTIELIYMQSYAPTTLAAARDYWTMRYTTTLEDGSLVICERSLTTKTGGPTGPHTTCFVRANMLPSGYLIRPCEGDSSVVHIVDHIDLDASSVPEVIRPLYESSKILAQKVTMAALRYVRQIAQETSGEIQYGGGRQPAVLRTFSQRLCRGFSDAINGFTDDGWSIIGSDGVEDVTIAINSTPNKSLGSDYNIPSMLPCFGGVLCAKASMLVHNVAPALLISFLREHRAEWADYGVDAYSAACLESNPYDVPCARPGGFPSTQVILPLAHTVEHEEFLEVVRMEGQGHSFSHDDTALSRDKYLLQLCSGVDENAVGTCAQLVFAPIDESFADDALLLPSGFRVIPLDSKLDGTNAATIHTLDLASTLDVGSGKARCASENHRSVLIIAFQFSYENHLRDNVAAMARQYVRSVVEFVQRVSMAIGAPSLSGSQIAPKTFPGSLEALTLARQISQSYMIQTGNELLNADLNNGDTILKQLWHHSDAIMCCSMRPNAASSVFTFSNQAGLDMLEATLFSLQDIALDKVLDEAGRKILLSEFSKIMQQGYANLPPGICLSSMGRPISYDQAIAWKVLNDEDTNLCLAFMFINWSFL